MRITKKKKEKIIKDNQLHETDTGSPEVQISILSKRIDALAKHLKKNRKDTHSRRGLLGMVEKRRKHLNYLEKKDGKRFAAIQKKVKQQ